MSKRKGVCGSVPNGWKSGLDMLQTSALQTEPIQGQDEKQMANNFLKIQPQPPLYPFIDVYFGVKIFIVDAKDNMKGGLEVPVTVEALYENGQLVPDQNIVSIDSKTKPVITGTGFVNLRVRMNQVSCAHENRSFHLRFSCKDQSCGPIMHVTSTMMTVIRHKLKIVTHPPEQWYKDEGGRDKCIQLDAMLVDFKGRQVKGREVPLRVTLLYEGSAGTAVKNQNILKLSQESKCIIDKSGMVQLRARIEEVSKNHQKQAFTIKLEPDASYSPANYDISSDISTSVTVLSKRNKRRKKSAKLEEKRNNAHHDALSVNTQLPLPSVTNALDSKSLAKLASGGGFGASVHGTIAWCQFVVKGLQNMEWQAVGYTADPGDPNIRSPIYRCPSCWTYKDTIRNTQHQPSCMLYRSIVTYQGSITTFLQDLAKAANKTVPNSLNGSLASSSQASQASQSSSAVPPPPTTTIMHTDSPNMFLAPSQQNPGVPLPGSTGPLPSELGNADGRTFNALPPPLPGFSGAREDSLNQVHVPLNLGGNGNGLTHAHSQSPVGGGLGSLNIDHGSLNIEHGFTFDLNSFQDPYTSEDEVSSVLVIQTQYGYPVFTDTNLLTGFYQYDDRTNVMSFVALSDYQGKIDAEKWPMQEAYQKHLENRSELIVTKQDYITLDRVKEQVLLVALQTQASGFLS